MAEQSDMGYGLGPQAAQLGAVPGPFTPQVGGKGKDMDSAGLSTFGSADLSTPTQPSDPSAQPAPEEKKVNDPLADTPPELRKLFDEKMKAYKDTLGREPVFAAQMMESYKKPDFNWKAFAGFSTIMLGLAAAFGRGGSVQAIAATTGLGAAIKGYMKGDREEAEAGRQAFLANSEAVMRNNYAKLSEFRQAHDKWAGNVEKQQEEMYQVALKHDMPVLADKLNTEGMVGALGAMDQYWALNTDTLFKTIAANQQLMMLGARERGKGTMEERDRQKMVAMTQWHEEGEKGVPPVSAQEYNTLVTKYSKESKIQYADGSEKTFPAHDLAGEGFYVPGGGRVPGTRTTEKPLSVQEQQQFGLYTTAKTSSDSAMNYFMPSGKMSMDNFTDYTRGYTGTGLIESNAKLADAELGFGTMIYMFSGKQTNEEEARRLGRAFMPNPVKGKKAVETGLQRLNLISGKIGELMQRSREPGIRKTYVEEIIAMGKAGGLTEAQAKQLRDIPAAP